MPKKKNDFVVVGPNVGSPPKPGRPAKNEKKQDDSVAREHFAISGTRRRSILVFRETPIANLRSFFYIVEWQFEHESARKLWMMVQRARRTELQRTVSGLFCVEGRVSIAFPLFHLFTIVGDYFECWVCQLFSIPRFRYEITYPCNTCKS